MQGLLEERREDREARSEDALATVFVGPCVQSPRAHHTCAAAVKGAAWERGVPEAGLVGGKARGFGGKI